MPKTWIIQIFLLILLSAATQASAHSVKWFNGTTYDYAVLLKGKNCCSDTGEECRPAFSYERVDGAWKLRIPKDGGDPNSQPVDVSALDGDVTYEDLGGDGIAHICGRFNEWGVWTAYCTFIPTNQRMTRREWFLDAALRLRAPRLRGSFFTGRA